MKHREDNFKTNKQQELSENVDYLIKKVKIVDRTKLAPVSLGLFVDQMRFANPSVSQPSILLTNIYYLMLSRLELNFPMW